MAIARDTNAEHIKPLLELKAVTQRVQLGATTEAGEIITEQSDGKWDPAAGTVVNFAVAVAVQGGVDTDWVDAVFSGPIECLTGATPGALVFVSDTAGEPAATAGTKSTVIGFSQTATRLYVRPQIVSFS